MLFLPRLEGAEEEAEEKAEEKKAEARVGGVGEGGGSCEEEGGRNAGVFQARFSPANFCTLPFPSVAIYVLVCFSLVLLSLLMRVARNQMF